MSFLNPLVLFGLAAAAIPIIIHLFNFRKPKKVDFSSVEFLKELQQNTMRRMHLKQLLLLALRTLAIAALVLSFSRPTLTGSLAESVGKRSSTSIALILDNSMSMDLRDAQGDYITQARELAKTVVNQMESGDEVSILTLAGRSPNEILPFTNQLLARDAIDQVVPSAGGKTLSSIIDLAQAKLAESSRPNREIYILSDLQASTFTDSSRVAAEKDANIVFIPIGSDPPANVAVESVKITSKIVEAGQPVRLQAGIRNYGQNSIQDLVVNAYLDEQRVAQSNIALAPGGFGVVDLVLTPKRRGWLSGQIQIESDIFESDNTRHFVLDVPERRRVLLVQGEGESGKYIDLALSAELTRGRVAFDITSIQENRLPATELTGFDAVILLGPKSISSGEVANLNSFVGNGGGLLLFPGSGADRSGLNDLLSRLGGGSYTTYMDGKGEPIASLGGSDFEHPIFDGMFDSDNRSALRMEEVQLFRQVNYQAGTGNEQSIVKLRSNQPYLHELNSGAGRSLIFSSMPDPSWSDLPLRGLFIPLMYRSLFYVSSAQSSEYADLTLGHSASVRIRTKSQDQVVLKHPSGEEQIPEQRVSQSATLISIPADLSEIGVYQILAGEETVSSLALNENPNESNLTRLDLAEASESLQKHTQGTVQLLSNVNSTSQLQRSLNEARSGVEIWNVLLVIALILLLCEMLVSVRWKSQIGELSTA